MGQRRRDELLTSLRGLRRITFDTSTCIYFLSGEPQRSELVQDAILAAAAGLLEVEIPGIVQMELLVGPLRSGDFDHQNRVLQFTEQTTGIRARAISRATLIASARIRAMTRMKTPDALVVGSAAVHSCAAILGNDRGMSVLNALSGLRLLPAQSAPIALPTYIHLDDYVD